MKTFTRHKLASSALLGALFLTGAPPAMADEHYIRVFPAGEICEFEFAYSSTGGKLQTRIWEDASGNPVRIIQAGRGVVLTYYNLDADKSVTINTAGSVLRLEVNDDGTSTGYITGHYGLILEGTDVGGPAVIQYTGRAVFTIDENNVFEVVRASGQQRDICAELA